MTPLYAYSTNFTELKGFFENLRSIGSADLFCKSLASYLSEPCRLFETFCAEKLIDQAMSDMQNGDDQSFPKEVIDSRTIFGKMSNKIRQVFQG